MLVSAYEEKMQRERERETFSGTELACATSFYACMLCREGYTGMPSLAAYCESRQAHMTSIWSSIPTVLCMRALMCTDLMH